MMRPALLAATFALAAPAAAVAAPTPPAAQAQSAAAPGQAVAAAPEPARLAAARRLIDLVMPPAERDRMVASMMEPMFANITQSMNQTPEMQRLFAGDPKARAVFDRYMRQQMDSSTRMLRAGLPSMLEAMSRAYARRMTAAELDQTAAFLATPAGQAYVQASPAVMNDPDMAAWMRDHMQKAMADMPAQIDAMMKELEAPAKDK